LSAVDQFDVELGIRPVFDFGRCVIGDVEIQGAVAIYVRQRHRSAAIFPEQSAVCRFGEMTLPVIEEEAGSSAERVDQQIQVSVSIDVRENCPGRILSRTSNARRSCDVRKFPIAQIAIKSGRVLEAAEKQVAPAVSIDVSRGHARAAQTHRVFQSLLLGNKICKWDSGLAWWK
jgi:hypothetical protein